MRMRRHGCNPLREAVAVIDLARLYRRIRPDVVHHVALKPVLYGSWAARLAGVNGVVNAVSGLGYAFTGRGHRAALFRMFARIAYRSALAGPKRGSSSRTTRTGVSSWISALSIRIGRCSSAAAASIWGVTCPPGAGGCSPRALHGPNALEQGRWRSRRGRRNLAAERCNGSHCPRRALGRGQRRGHPRGATSGV